MLLSSTTQALAPARHLQRASRCQAPGVSRLAVRGRKQTEKQDVDADLADTALPADLSQLSKLAKAELQQQLESRGLDKDGNKEELANRLLDSMIAQESALSSSPPDRVLLQQQLDQPSAAGRRGRRTSRKATASADPQPELPGQQASDPVVAAAAASAAVAEQVVDASAATAAGRRGRKTSRKATTSTDPLPSPADIVAAAETSKPTAGRGRKTSRKATSSADPLPSASAADAMMMPAVPAASSEEAVGAVRRGRKTSRKATTSAEPTQDPVAAAAAAAAAEAAVEAPAAAADVGNRRGRRSKSTAADPIPAAAATEEVAAKAGRGRRTSRKSSIVEAEAAATELLSSTPAATDDAAAPASTRQRGRRSSTQSASAAPEAAAAAAASTSTPPLSRAKLMAQQLAQKEMAAHGGAAAAAAADAPAAAAPGSSWVTSPDLLSAGSQAQPGSLLIGGDSSIDNGSIDEVMAQLTAERASGLADEPALRPEAVLSSTGLQQPQQPAAATEQPALADIAAAADAAPQQYMQSLVEAPAAVDAASDSTLSAFDHMTLPPSAGTADATAAAGQQHPSLADCVAAVEEPLAAAAAQAMMVVVDEAPDAAMAAFDHTPLDSRAAAAVASGNQSPSLQDIALAVESEGSPLPPSLEESMGEDEEPDVALAAFDHMAPVVAEAPVAAAAAADEVSGYDQAYLDPLQPSATVGSGSMDLADASEVVMAELPAAVVPAAVAAPAAATAAPAKQPQQHGTKQQEADLSVMMQRWWASVVAMFEDWQKNLSNK